MRTPLLILLCCIATAGAQAQGPRYHLGALLGVNAPTNDFGLGWNAGMIGQLDCGKRMILQGQIGEVLERNSSSGNFFADDPYTTYSVQSRRSWIELSTLAVFHPQIRSNVGLLLGIGVSTRLLMHASTKGTLDRSQTHQGTTSGTADMTDRIYRWNYGLPLQLGMDFKIGNQKIAWLFEYQLPLRNLYKPITSDPNGGFDYSWTSSSVKYNSLTLKVAYLLPIRK
jgi:hypothetical protein